MSEKRLKDRLYIVIFEADTPAGKRFDVLLFIAIMVSVLLTMLSSVKSVYAAHGALLLGLNALFTVLFTIEYGLRLYCARKPSRYARSFFGLVDLLSVLPFYIGLFIPSTRFLDVIKVLRMLRIFRVL